MRIKRFNEGFEVKEMSLEFIQNVLIDMVDDGFVIHGPYDDIFKHIEKGNNYVKFYIDRGVNEDDMDEESDEIFFDLSTVIDSLVKLVEYVKLDFSFSIGNLRNGNDNLTIEELIEISKKSLAIYTYIVIEIKEN